LLRVPPCCGDDICSTQFSSAAVPLIPTLFGPMTLFLLRL